MANKKITDLPASTTLSGEIEIVHAGASKRVQVYQGAWDWSAEGDALPTSWPVGSWGYGVGERYTIGNPEYVDDGVLIFRKSSGATFSDFKFL